VIQEPEVIVREDGRAGRLTLNRPRALHALTTAMCQAMIEALEAWRSDPAVELVILDHTGERGFCAGGDIRMLAQSGAGDGTLARQFFFLEYQLNHLLFAYPKPVVALMDGVTMGGGVGISLPARFRVATERTTFAMPETGIGLFPDVGGGWYLPRLPGSSGRWLGLTGERLKGPDCLALGIATHFVDSPRLEAVKAVLVSEGDPAAALPGFVGRPDPAPIEAVRANIDRLFAGPSVEAIIEALRAETSDWAADELTRLRTKSPQALKVTFRQLKLGGAMNSFAENMAMEYRIASRVVRRHDFIEGVRAVIVDKDNAPRWNPSRLEDVSEALLDEIFAPLPAGEAWGPLP